MALDELKGTDLGTQRVVIERAPVPVFARAMGDDPEAFKGDGAPVPPTFPFAMAYWGTVEGQAKGIQRMIEDGRDCVDVMNQLAAVKAAVSALSGELLESFALHCLRHPEQFSSPEQAVEQAVRALVRSGR